MRSQMLWPFRLPFLRRLARKPMRIVSASLESNGAAAALAIPGGWEPNPDLLCLRVDV